MVDSTTAREPRTRDERIALVVVVASAFSIVSFMLVGMLGVAVNRIVYMVANGGPPPAPENGSSSDRLQWAGYMPFEFPWWYFAASGALVLLVSVLAINRKWRFIPTNHKYFAYRTSIGYLAIVGAFLTALHYFAVGFYYTDSNAGLYLIGPALCLLSALIALAVYLIERRTNPVRAGAHSRGGRTL